ncbi:hypothetical protein JCM15519_18730 [Fundidesulfovibrio butyratiphilus]
MRQASPDTAKGPITARPAPFAVPEDVKHLGPAELAAFTQAFKVWSGRGRTQATRTSRRRVWLIYLVLRYTGARLGEVLSLDERTDLNVDEGVVVFRGRDGDETLPREVLVPPEVAEELAKALESPEFSGMRGEVFHMDAGYIRLKFHERAAEAEVEKGLASPRVLRNSRAIELLRSGMPLSVVQHILGHKSASLTAQYLSFTSQAVRNILQQHILKESAMKTSARNAFTGSVTAIRQGMILSEVEVTTASGNVVTSVVTKESFEKLGIAEGMAMTATIKAPQVIVLKEPAAGKTSARNRFFGKIVRVNEGLIAAEVVVKIADGTEVCALITDVSVKSLGLAVGDEVWVMFKAFSVVLNAD